jgi:hypothetical protein
MCLLCVCSICVCMYMCVRAYVTGHHCGIYPIVGSCIPDLVPVPLHTTLHHIHTTHAPAIVSCSAMVECHSNSPFSLPPFFFPFPFLSSYLLISPPRLLIPCHNAVYCTINSIPFHSLPFHSLPFHSLPFHSLPFLIL